MKLFSSLKLCFSCRERQMRTVRFMFPVVMSTLLMLAAAVVTTSEKSYIRLAISDETVEAGGYFSVDVFAYAHVPVNAVDITLRFDSSVVEVVEVDRGQSVLTIWTQDPIIEKDKVVLQGGTYRKGFLREHKIATLDLRAKQAGQSTFSVTDVMLLAGDGEGSTVAVAGDSETFASLYIYDENGESDNIGVDAKVGVVTDINADGAVTLKDVSVFMAAWANGNKIYDFNGDGKMTFRDFSIILANLIF